MLLTFSRKWSIICRYTYINGEGAMIITFCGHAQFPYSEEYEKNVMAFLEEKVAYRSADMYLGGYGAFDSFAYRCSRKYKETHPNISLVLVTPYLNGNKLITQRERYDSVLYPEIEDKPKRFAITYRNMYMVEKADYVVAYVSHDWGGAYATYKYAKRIGKKIFNLADFEKN